MQGLCTLPAANGCLTDGACCLSARMQSRSSAARASADVFSALRLPEPENSVYTGSANRAVKSQALPSLYRLPSLRMDNRLEIAARADLRYVQCRPAVSRTYSSFLSMTRKLLS